MIIHVITYKGKPVTLDKLQDLEQIKYRNLGKAERKSFIASGSRKATIELFLASLGYTWAERTKGIECEKAVSSLCATVEVSGGVAEVTDCPPQVQINIIDHDNLDEEEPDADAMGASASSLSYPEPTH
jgi:hypothetical protein